MNIKKDTRLKNKKGIVMAKTKQLTVVVVNPKSEEYYTSRINEINKIFERIYKKSNTA